MGRPRIRGIRLRLALALLVLVAGALGVVYLIVVPSLEAELVKSKLDQLEEDAERVAPRPRDERRGAAGVRGVRVLARPGAGRRLHGDRAIRALQSGRLEPDVVARRRAGRGRAPGRAHRQPRARHRRARGAAVRGGGAGRRPERVGGPAQRLARRPALERPLRPAAAARRGPDRAPLRRRRRLRCSRRCTHGGSAGSSAPRSGSPAGASTSRSSTAATTSSGELATAFERMRVRLENLDRARSEFIANASHELRTPLFSLGGFLELMADEELDEPTRQEFLETMREQVERLTKLATDLLDLSRLDAGRMQHRARAGRSRRGRAGARGRVPRARRAARPPARGRRRGRAGRAGRRAARAAGRPRAGRQRARAHARAGRG